MSLFTVTERRRKSNNRRNQLRHRRLAMEGLEDRCLLTVVSLIPIKDNTLIEDTSTTLGSTSNGAGDIFVGLNNDGDRTKRGLMEFDVAGERPRGLDHQQCYADHVGEQEPVPHHDERRTAQGAGRVG